MHGTEINDGKGRMIRAGRGSKSEMKEGRGGGEEEEGKETREERKHKWVKDLR